MVKFKDEPALDLIKQSGQSGGVPRGARNISNNSVYVVGPAPLAWKSSQPSPKIPCALQRRHLLVLPKENNHAARILDRPDASIEREVTILARVPDPYKHI
jgi:hypothetical protein